MITREFLEACAEINEIFKMMNKDDLNKLPQELRETFNKIQPKDYISHVDNTKPLYKQKLKKKTKEILVALYVKYWCEDKDREVINKILSANYEKKQLKLREKYNPNDIFKNRDKLKKYDEKNNLIISEYEETIFRKIINKISKLLKK